MNNMMVKGGGERTRPHILMVKRKSQGLGDTRI